MLHKQAWRNFEHLQPSLILAYNATASPNRKCFFGGSRRVSAKPLRGCLLTSNNKPARINRIYDVYSSAKTDCISK